MTTLAAVIALVEARLSTLNGQLADATRVGDIASVARIEADVVEVEQTLTQLRAIGG